ncbi:MAG: DinB family protein [Cytophagaceae bacterium]|nr:DinB family protein [Cytophagaceae bacterium]
MKKEFAILKVTRKNILNLIQNFSDEQLIKIPSGFNNNILWNAGHVITANQKLCYALSGLPVNMPESYSSLFGKGSNPRDWTSTPEIAKVKELLISTADLMESDYNKGVFKTYKEYETSYGYPLKNIEEAIAFNNVHEGLHLGVIMTLRKLV